ncbi:hypothetical protein A2837_01745 [Candidatus Kaiserbacteria bacterium RIFCSPHIGHO2_01_FULL_46_22]|uniref:AB hydrolase-1 domain-containing protein n=1 Tax=Candidatus Kaiserbacteria bacterium RIFCSPHIGHO2_01_FULL_46_22 TaxID=1798475 RepID=A0A1F6BYL3_9BACT|nr:MAG: hypothetical protein A2837_01745 [Candidatus Kaiserbacteria bacterium RIFCSPHIGHO2_01_FULL_46_22]
MKERIDVLYIHGGNTFVNDKDYLDYLRTKKVPLGKIVKWNGDNFQDDLGPNFRVTWPRMPLQDNARYRDWKIMFENYLPLLKGKYILVGGSLGGIFLAKYLSENKLSKKPISVYFVCPPFDDTVPGHRLAGNFKLKNDLSLIEENCNKLYFLFSEDDDVVPVSHAEKYRVKLPKAKVAIYKSKNGHFLIKKFPEIVKMIKADALVK